MQTGNYTYRFRVYPNKTQRQHLARTFGCARFVYNWAKEAKSNAYHGDGDRWSFARTSREMTKLKRQEETEWLSEVSAVILQQSLRNLETAFTNFFEGRAQYPRFKRKHGKQAARYVGTAFDVREDESGKAKLKLAKMPGLIRIRWSRPMKAVPSSCTVTKDAAGRYHVCFNVEKEIDPLPPRNKVGGIDLGITDVVTTSDGWKSGNPRSLGKAKKRLRREQKALSRKQKGSKSWKRQKRRVAKAHAKVADQRRDFQHKLTTKLVREYDVISCETLSVKNMMQNHNLAGAIADVGWGEVIRQLEYKGEWYGTAVVKIDRWFPSSKRCSACGHEADKMPLSVRKWTCSGCGAHHDRDVNAAKNISRVGHTRFQAVGETGKSMQGFELAGSSR